MSEYSLSHFLEANSQMNLQKSISTITAVSILTIASTIAPISNVEANSIEKFVCQQDGREWTTVYQSSRIEKTFIRWTSDFGGLVDYTPKKRCFEVTNRLNDYLKNQRPFYITHGRTKDGKYPIICRTDQEGAGCKGLIYTLDPKGRRHPSTIVTELLEIANPKVSTTSSGVPATSCPIYVDVRLYLQGKDSAKYVCRT
jgi:hypothetical protein